MTYSERKQYYEKIGTATTEVFKKTHPGVCKVVIHELEKDHENNYRAGDILVKITSTYMAVNPTEVEKFINSYFNIKTRDVFLSYVGECVD